MRIIALPLHLRDKLVDFLPETLALVSCKIQDEFFDPLAWSSSLQVHCERDREVGGRNEEGWREGGEEERGREGRQVRDSDGKHENVGVK